jgi:polysaccharide chain length determinant protein (PEP-CTERM system associated)
MENHQRQQIKKYFILLLSHWRLLALCLLVAVAVGLGGYLRMAKIYRCSALLSYERQQINPARMAPEQRNRQIRDTVSTLQDLVLSRKNLESLINEFDLYKKAREQRPLESIVDMMRRNIRISPSNRGDTFTVSFKGSDQEKVMQVTNTLAERFIKENLKYREERATETSNYTKDELNIAKTVLDYKEKAMRDYKLEHYNSMPEQRANNLARLNALHEQYQGVQDSIQDLERTKVMIQEQVNLRRSLVGSAATSSQANSSQSETVTPWQRLQQLRHHLESLTGKYTDKHPEIRRTKQLIALLESELEGTSSSSANQTGARARHVQDPEIGQLQIQLKEVSLNIKKLRDDQRNIRSEIPQYERWIAETPVREAEWNAITRDYNELRRNYDYLVSQNLQASSVEHLEKKQKGSKFKIVDRARFPEKPYAPRFLRIILLSIMAGLGAGVGLVLAMDFIDTSFKDVAEVEDYLELPVVTSIPYLMKHSEVGAQRRKTVFLGAMLLLFLVLLLGCLMYCRQKGLIVF